MIYKRSQVPQKHENSDTHEEKYGRQDPPTEEKATLVNRRQ
jgi:hypothetical protein